MNNSTNPISGADENRHLLVSPADLLAEIQNDSVTVLDCTVDMEPIGEGRYSYSSGFDSWKRASIPSSLHADLFKEFGQERNGLRFMMPSAHDLAVVLQQKGIDPERPLVLYSNTGPYWATRVYWTFKVMGVTTVRMLDGDLQNWQSRGFPVVPGELAAPLDYLPDLHFNPDLMADVTSVLAAMEDPETLILNALSEDVHSGRRLVPSYKRRGRIPGSSFLPGVSLWDSERHCFASVEFIRSELDRVGALSAPSVITYCGGGILASTLAFALDLVGAGNARIYDGSMTEWGPNEDLPIEVD